VTRAIRVIIVIMVDDELDELYRVKPEDFTADLRQPEADDRGVGRQPTCTEPVGGQAAADRTG
jgi:hypothetical protein